MSPEDCSPSFFKHSNFFSTFFQLTSALCGPARRFSFFIVAVLVMVQDGNRSAWQYANELRFFFGLEKVKDYSKQESLFSLTASRFTGSFRSSQDSLLRFICPSCPGSLLYPPPWLRCTVAIIAVLGHLAHNGRLAIFFLIAQFIASSLLISWVFRCHSTTLCSCVANVVDLFTQ
jgi:hypothetical protein